MVGDSSFKHVIGLLKRTPSCDLVHKSYLQAPNGISFCGEITHIISNRRTMSTEATEADSLQEALEAINKGKQSMNPINDVDLARATTPISRAQVLTRRSQLYALNRTPNLAFRDLKEALSLAPQNADIVSAIQRLQNMSMSDPTDNPRQLFGQFVKGDKKAGEKLASSMMSESFAKDFVDANLLPQLLEMVTKDPSTCGRILLRLSMNDSKEVSKQLVRATDETTSFIDSGPDGIEAFTNIILRKWEDDKRRHGTLQTFVTKLADCLATSTDVSNQVAVLNACIRIATSDQTLQSVNQLPVNILFPLLSQQQPQSVRSRALVLSSTLISKEEGDSSLIKTLESELKGFIAKRSSSASAADYITAFSVLTAIFTIRADVGVDIFLDGFLEEALEDILDLEDENLPKALLELLSGATVDKKCRTKIGEVANEFLHECAQSHDPGKRALAASIMAKLSSVSTELTDVGVDLLRIFKDADASKNESALLSAVEGLAFSSTVGKTKEELVKDSGFLSCLLAILKAPGREHHLIYGCLSILVNLTSYKPPLSEEEKRINEIRHLAKETNVPTFDELDDNAHVAARCKAVLTAGLLPALNAMAINSSPASITAIAQILLAVSTVPSHRGMLAQHGAIKLILALLAKQVDLNTEITLIHALAKILISVNPSLVFSSRTPITAPIQPLTHLLTQESLPHDLPRFESLLALTNLASANDTARTSIVSHTWSVTETLLLSDAPLLQRAATELVCNLVVCQTGAEKFSVKKSAGAIGRLHLLMALADVEDVATRRAAGGALAMLTDLPEVCDGIREVERGVERIGGMVLDEDEDVAFRGLICVKNLIGVGGGELKKQLQDAGISGKIMALAQRSSNARLKGLCVEVLEQIQ